MEVKVASSICPNPCCDLFFIVTLYYFILLKKTYLWLFVCKVASSNIEYQVSPVLRSELYVYFLSPSCRATDIFEADC